MCFFNCTGVAVGYVNANDGNVNLTDFLKAYTGKIPQIYLDLMQICLPKSTGDNGCQKAYNLRKCMIKKGLNA